MLLYILLERIIVLKKLLVFCLIATILPFMDADGWDYSFYAVVGGDIEITQDIQNMSDQDGSVLEDRGFLFNTQEECNAACRGTCIELYDENHYDYVGDHDQFVVCPEQCKLSSLEDLFGQSIFYAHCNCPNNYTKEVYRSDGIYKLTYIPKPNLDICYSQWKQGGHGWFCNNVNLGEITFCTGLVYSISETLEYCNEGYYYDSGTDSCKSCGNIEKNGTTYNLTSNAGNKYSREKACYVSSTGTDNRGTYNLKAESGGVCTVEMLEAN